MPLCCGVIYHSRVVAFTISYQERPLWMLLTKQRGPWDMLCGFWSLLIRAVFLSPFLSPSLHPSFPHPVFYVPVSDKKEDLVIPPVVMPTPGKRGRKKKSMMQRAGANLPPGSDALILAHLAAGGQVIRDLK